MKPPTKQPDGDTLQAERVALDAERTRRTEQRNTVAGELAEAEHRCEFLSDQREHLRLLALADKDAAAVAELEEITRQATAAILQREDLAGVLRDLDAHLGKLDVAIERTRHRGELAELRIMQQERRQLAVALDAKALELADLAHRYGAHTLTMSRRAFAAGISNGGRIHEPNGVLGSILARIAANLPFTRTLHASHRDPLTAQVDAWASTFDEQNAPAEPATVAA